VLLQLCERCCSIFSLLTCYPSAACFRVCLLVLLPVFIFFLSLVLLCAFKEAADSVAEWLVGAVGFVSCDVSQGVGFDGFSSDTVGLEGMWTACI
jgi:hypothetical protein